ncbi:MAG: 4Fe-4S dicluster domain-containing protein [Mitsuokella multacida]|nr:4Fe-4S dicluster domain-containing protein [Mitsuokella multacida]
MKIKAQISMVMNLDKCIGCHTCSITCKNVWTNREGAEYMYFNNVETKPGIGYPKNWEDQEKWKGGWKLGKDGKLSLRTGSKPERLLKLFYHPDQPEMDDYYEPWTYDYETLIHSKRRNHQPIARPRSLVTGERMEIKWGPNWEDDLANGESARQDINLKKMAADITLEFHDLFMKYLPRVCNHCLNPACVAACPSGAIYKREEDGVVLVSQDGCRGWRHCVPACPYKKVYFNWKTNKAEKCIFCFPRLEDDLANGESARQDINLKKMAADITLEFHDLFMKYLPRVCNHCLNPACVAACPSGAIYKREEDGVVLVSQDGCRGWRHCVPACPYKKVYFNWKTNKAEKCIFCFPRLENGLPTICADTCVGRLRYMGVLLYDMDKVVPAASTRDKGEIYHQVLDVIADPNDPEVIEAARKEGIPENWIKAAQDSPVYKIVKDWQLALPLHPEFRTLPMVWYVPPLSPITRRAEANCYLPDVDEMRIPIAYLAEIFAAGNTAVMTRTLQRLLDMRAVMRAKTTGDDVPSHLEFAPEVYEKMFRLLGIAKYKDRFNIPAGIQGKTNAEMHTAQGGGLFTCPGGGC